LRRSTGAAPPACDIGPAQDIPHAASPSTHTPPPSRPGSPRWRPGGTPTGFTPARVRSVVLDRTLDSRTRNQDPACNAGKFLSRPPPLAEARACTPGRQDSPCALTRGGGAPGPAPIAGDDDFVSPPPEPRKAQLPAVTDRTVAKPVHTPPRGDVTGLTPAGARPLPRALLPAAATSCDCAKPEERCRKTQSHELRAGGTLHATRLERGISAARQHGRQTRRACRILSPCRTGTSS
jgi:hypothetical protein